MSLKLTYLSHSGFLFDDGEFKLLMDPFLTGNERASHIPMEIECDVIALTHGHADHVGDTVDIAKRTGAKVIAAYELCNYLAEQGVENVDPGNPGGRVYTDFGYVALTQAFHSSSYEGRYMGQPCGLVIAMGDKKVYHAGDTALFSDMKLIGELSKPDVSLLPVGDRFTMGPELATIAAEFVGAPITVPIHYKTFPVLRQDCQGFEPKGIEVRELHPGETLTLV